MIMLIYLEPGAISIIDANNALSNGAVSEILEGTQLNAYWV